MRARWATAAAALVAVAVSGCGGSGSPQPVGNRIKGDQLTIYVSAPQNGGSKAAGEAVTQGAALALAGVHSRIGRYRIVMRVLDESTPNNGAWNAGAASQSAQTAAGNPTTIGYIGGFNSGASAVAIPILNRLAIAQVSPASTAVGLTSGGAGSAPGSEPFEYYPTKLRTFARVVPSDAVQAEVQVKLQRQMGCGSVYVLDDLEYDGAEASAAFQQVAQSRHYPVVSESTYVAGESSYASIGQTIAQDGADCVLIAAIPESSAARLAASVAKQVPGVQIFATADLAQPSFTDAARGGIPRALDAQVLITAPGGDPDSGNPLMRGFISSYERRYGTPLPVAVDGYEAMRLLLRAINRATDHGRDQAQRTKVVTQMLKTRDHQSPLGSYSIKRDGDTTLDSYGVYRIVRGKLRYWRSIKG